MIDGKGSSDDGRELFLMIDSIQLNIGSSLPDAFGFCLPLLSEGEANNNEQLDLMIFVSLTKIKP